MHFSADDRFRLAPRIASLLPVPGAASVRVGDLVYGIDGENYRYVFSTEYTTGVLRTKTSVRRVASYCEPRDPTAAAEARKQRCDLAFAPESLPLIEQYEHLLGAAGSSPPAETTASASP
jgi:hypothetical protein